jgi:alkylation response protein AidB-like acyl-CoA dehydrogenase
VIGLRAVGHCGISFEECSAVRIGEGRGSDYARLAQRALVAHASAAVGVARAAWEYAAEYAKERTTFGKPIAQYQSIAFMLAEAAMDTEAARWMTWKAATRIDSGADALREAGLAYRFATDACFKIADNGVQILGGHGVIRDHLAELFFRNARALGTTPGWFIV